MNKQEFGSNRPFNIMIKPGGSLCNLDCRYCYYSEKSALFSENTGRKMTDECLEAIVRQQFLSQQGDEVQFAWQGGEPTVCGLPFFERAVALQRKYSDGRRFSNALQTNGTLLNDDWCRFLAEHEFLVGISIDGPENLHDRFRTCRSGGGSFEDVMRGVELLKKHGVNFNTLTCVHRANEGKGKDVYRFLRGIGSQHMQFIPVVERETNAIARNMGLRLATPAPLRRRLKCQPRVTSWSVTPVGYSRFMMEIFDRWIQHDVGRIHIQLFEEFLARCLGVKAGLCVFSEQCGQNLVVEHDGSVFSCDHFVYPDFKLGTVQKEGLQSCANDERQLAFGASKLKDLPKQCLRCPVKFACNGGCPKHRFSRSVDGEPGLNYLCTAYRSMFEHMGPWMLQIRELISRGRPASDIMLVFQSMKAVR